MSLEERVKELEETLRVLIDQYNDLLTWLSNLKHSDFGDLTFLEEFKMKNFKPKRS